VTDLHVRTATLRDADAIDDLLNAFAMVHQGRSLDPGAAHARLTEPDSELALVEDPAGTVLGFGHAWRAGPVIRCQAMVRPGATGQGVGTALLSHMEQRARIFDLSVFNVMQLQTDTAGPGLLRGRGYTEICHRLLMQVGLDGYRPPDTPAPPDVDITVLDRDRDAAQLFAAHRAAFPEDADDESKWWQERTPPEMRFDPALWFVARRAGDIVGFCLGSRRDWNGSPDGYISDVGVVPAERGRGIAFALLTRAITAFAAAGLPTASLNVDADNLTGAIRLYRKAGMQPSPSATEWSKTLS
jgi:ribosomal protein S18 acetylase RimI-like enzyme